MARFPAWLLDLTGLLAAAGLAAWIANGVLVEALATRPTYREVVLAKQSAHPRLDDVTLARAFGWSAPRPPPARPFRGQLHGTLVANQPAWSSALVSDGAGTRVCLEGERLDDAVVVGIEPGLLHLRRDDATFDLALAPTQPGLPLPPPPLDLQRLLTGARAIPTVEGFRLLDIRPDSVYARSGLQNGDLIRAVAGFRTPDALLAHANELLAAGSADVEVERAGRIQHLRVDLRD